MGKKDEKIDIDTEFVSEDAEMAQMKGKNEARLRKELKEAKVQTQEYLEGWQRAKADLINFKREAEEGKKDFVRFANQDFIHQLLPVLDSFEMALTHTDDSGVKQIFKQLISVLKSKGVEQMKPEGKMFDPKEHDPVEMVVIDNKKEDGKILEVVQTGYKLHDKIIRAPRVRVGEYKKT